MEIDPDPPVGRVHFEWVEIPNPNNTAFQDSKIYSLIDEFFATDNHTHTIANITNLQSTLNNLQTALNNKADTTSLSNKQDKLSKTTSSATAYTTNIDSGTFNLSKYGNLVILDFDFTHKMNSSDVSLDRMVANGIPSEYRPSGTIGTSVNGLRTSNYDDSYFHYVYVNTDGQVRTTFKVTNGYSIRVRGQLMWIV